ncbi:formyltransferase family protein [Eubacterium oxidoreducens]|uniref:Methionyl-tRNA formyltransferase n=1 Tax=Eubacterium oxidoreducens TaxID=1732 RepID=A0A1G6AAC0_EUBOX|nr:formyltransferase family protein [Eubacterium oxidoreducens]SDB05387.1 Methionyl-tRNA formyltransferase [Eubacterium oxidoreducens]
MKKIKVGFLGYGTRALDALMEHDGFEVQAFVAPRSRLCTDVYEAKHRYASVPFSIVKNNDELAQELDKHKDIACFLMNACPIILNEKVLQKMPIYNVHPGSLAYNRGHQPHLWTVLLGEKESEIVLHTVTTGIDEGEIIGREVCAIRREMNALDVLDCLEDQLPKLLDCLYQHIVNGTSAEQIVTGGEYRPVMRHEDYEVLLENIIKPSFTEEVLRKIRTRSMHHGAFFVYKKERVYIDRLLDEETINRHEGGSKPIVSLCGSVAILESANHRWVFHVNKREELDE